MDRSADTERGTTDTVELRRTEPDDRPPGSSAPPDDRPDRRIPGGRLAAGLAILVLLFLFVGQVLDILPRLGNPFSERTVDRSQPVLLQSIQDLSQYEAATGNFQVIIDLEKDARFIPAIIRGERTLFVAAGSVDVSVDFSTLQAGAIEVSEDRDSVRIVLPRPQLERANVDTDRSYVYSQQRGLLDRIGSVFSSNPSNQQQLYVLGAERIQAAAAESGLVERAETNTRAMLTGMLQSLGFRTIDVEFQDS
ncbi:MAG TPA: DUF4230 domain-containing protein [Actinomycetes bacterium]|nr:DUF4230 domain-containing protein [Actinomycetes bacterium]